MKVSSKVTRKEVSQAVSKIFETKPTIKEIMLNQWRNWEHEEPILPPVFIGAASDYKCRTLGKFDTISINYYLTLSTRVIPYDSEFDSEFGYSYILECMRHSYGVRNWFRDGDYDYLTVGDNYQYGWGFRNLRDSETTIKIYNEFDCMHEWYAMIRAFQDPNFAKYWLSEGFHFSVTALHLLNEFFLWTACDRTNVTGGTF